MVNLTFVFHRAIENARVYIKPFICSAFVYEFFVLYTAVNRRTVALIYLFFPCVVNPLCRIHKITVYVDPLTTRSKKLTLLYWLPVRWYGFFMWVCFCTYCLRWCWFKQLISDTEYNVIKMSTICYDSFGISSLNVPMCQYRNIHVTTYFQLCINDSSSMVTSPVRIISLSCSRTHRPSVSWNASLLCFRQRVRDTVVVSISTSISAHIPFMKFISRIFKTNKTLTMLGYVIVWQLIDWYVN